MQGIGEVLKKAREEKGVTLDEVAEATKIRSKYLDAIEKEDFQVLPGEVYARGFVTAYLRYLDIKDRPDVVDLMKTKTVSIKTEEPAPAHVEDARERERHSRASRKAAKNYNSRKKMPAASFEEKPLSKKSSMIIILSIIAVILLLALQWVYSNSQQENLPQGQTQQEQQNAEDPSTTEPDGSGDTPEPVQPEEPVAPVYDGLEMQLEILNVNANATDQCWMQITADGQRTETTMSEGQTQQIRATDSIQLNLGNAGVVRITLNGQDLGVQGSQGEVVRRTFQAEDYVTAGQ